MDELIWGTFGYTSKPLRLGAMEYQIREKRLRGEKSFAKGGDGSLSGGERARESESKGRFWVDL